jgi:hypothetical protein
MYKQTITEIKNIDWKSMNPISIILVSFFTAQEFAESLRVALRMFPDSKPLREMAAGELETDNLQFGSYSQIGDHWEFLFHFLREKFGIIGHVNVARKAWNANCAYLTSVQALTREQRAMTIFSRELELPQIFAEILPTHDWKALDLEFYQYYLTRHIQLDTEEGGHGDLVSNFRLDEEVLTRFWNARLTLYREVLESLGPQT